MCCLENLAEIFWQNGDYFREGAEVPTHDLPGFWCEIEGGMQAMVVTAEVGKPGVLLFKFPAHTSEREHLHVHPKSARVLTIMSGTGTFVAIRNGQEVRHAICPGCLIYMGKNVPHNLFAETELIVESYHLPYLSPEDPNFYAKWGG